MATEQLTMEARLKDHISKNMKNIRNNINKFGKQSDQSFDRAERGASQFMETLKGFVGAQAIIGGVTRAFEALKGTIKGSITAYGTQAEAEATLRNAFGDNIDRLKDYASALQAKTKFGDEATLQAQAMLANLDITEDQLIRLTRVTQDFATEQDIGLKQAAQRVQRVIGQGSKTFAKYGAELDTNASQTENATTLIETMGEKLKGTAEAAASAGTGPLVQLQNAIGDVQEKIGELIIKSFQASGVFSKLSGMVKRLNEWFEQNSTVLTNRLSKAIKNTANTVTDLVNFLKNNWGWLSSLLEVAVYEAIALKLFRLAKGIKAMTVALTAYKALNPMQLLGYGLAAAIGATVMKMRQMHKEAVAIGRAVDKYGTLNNALQQSIQTTSDAISELARQWQKELKKQAGNETVKTTNKMFELQKAIEKVNPDIVFGNDLQQNAKKINGLLGDQVLRSNKLAQTYGDVGKSAKESGEKQEEAAKKTKDSEAAGIEAIARLREDSEKKAEYRYQARINAHKQLNEEMFENAKMHYNKIKEAERRKEQWTSDLRSARLSDMQSMQQRLQQMRNQDVINHREAEQMKTKLTKKESKLRLQRQLETASTVGGALSDLYGTITQAARGSAKEQKAMAKGQAAINTALAITRIWAQTGNPVVAGALTAIATAKLAAQMAVIENQKFAKGGIVEGNKTIGDKQPVLANSGEMVRTKGQQKRLFDMANGQGNTNNVSVGINIPAGTPVDQDAATRIEKAAEDIGDILMRAHDQGKLDQYYEVTQ